MCKNHMKKRRDDRHLIVEGKTGLHMRLPCCNQSTKRKALSQELADSSQHAPRRRLGGRPGVSHRNPRAPHRGRQVLKRHEAKPADKKHTSQTSNGPQSLADKGGRHYAHQRNRWQPSKTKGRHYNAIRYLKKTDSTYSNENTPAHTVPSLSRNSFTLIQRKQKQKQPAGPETVLAKARLVFEYGTVAKHKFLWKKMDTKMWAFHVLPQ